MALLKNNRGEYNYHFTWKDCNGHSCGFNDVWATNKRTAVDLALAMELNTLLFRKKLQQVDIASI